MASSPDSSFIPQPGLSAGVGAPASGARPGAGAPTQGTYDRIGIGLIPVSRGTAPPCCCIRPRMWQLGIICGPGRLAQCHVADEYVEIEQLSLAAKVYAQMLVDWCG